MTEQHRTEKAELHAPDLEELRGVLQAGLKTNFAEVQVSVVECPDLTRDPYQFPAKGLCGSPRIADIGGVQHLTSSVKLKKEYDMNVISKQLELPGAFILGATRGPASILGFNAEVITLILTELEGRPAVNGSYYTCIGPVNGKRLQGKYSDKTSDCQMGPLGNLYACEGKPGKVVEVRAKKRTGNHSLVKALRKTLSERYPDKSLALGGVFIIQKGKAKVHLMPREAAPCPVQTPEEAKDFLRMFEISAPVICPTVLVSRDPDMDLRVEHTHCFSRHGEGGHYHTDTTPDTVEYLGYFMPAELVYRIDRPTDAHAINNKSIIID